MEPKSYAFITGCARSGTSALAELIGNHPQIVMGMERYGVFYDAQRLELGPEHFERERFFDVRPGDTFYTDFNAFHAWDPNIRTKFDDASYVGDKRPNIHRHYDQIFARFEGATIYYIYRDIFEVAGSWEARRAAVTDWPPEFDFKIAVSTWSESLRMTLDAIRSGKRVIPVSYAEYFEGTGDLAKLFRPLNLDTTEVDARYYASQQEVREIIRNRRTGHGPRLTDDQRAFLEDHADFAAVAEIDAIALAQPAL